MPSRRTSCDTASISAGTTLREAIDTARAPAEMLNRQVEWAIDHGFLLTPDAPAMLDFYGRRSPIFMAARFDATRARTLGQGTAGGAPDVCCFLRAPTAWASAARLCAVGRSCCCSLAGRPSAASRNLT